MTASSSDEAGKIVKALLEKRLVACANIMAPHKSMYRWNDKIETGEEIAVIMKTQAGLFEKLREKILEMHSYECPCIVALPIEAGHADFMAWIASETA